MCLVFEGDVSCWTSGDIFVFLLVVLRFCVDPGIVFASRIPPRLLRTRGLVVKSCAVPVWKLSFVLILGHWPHIGPVLGATLGCLWGPGGLPRGPGGFQETTPDDPNRVLGVPLGCLWGPGFPRGAGSLQETTQATQNGPPAAEARRVYENAQA